MSTATLTPQGDTSLHAQETISPLTIAPADHDLTVVIPAHNEEQRLPKTLAQLTAFLDDWGVDYRVLVADDGSSDRTDVLARRHGPRCSTLRMTPQGGKGRAVRTAMLRATGRVLAFTDADLPFDLTALQQGYELICRDECQVVFGARDMKQSQTLGASADGAAIGHVRVSRGRQTPAFRGKSPTRSAA